MKKIILFCLFLLSNISTFAQDASISEFFGAQLDFYAQQFDGQKFLILRFEPSKDRAPLEDTSIKLMFEDGTTTKWNGYNIRNYAKSSAFAINGKFASTVNEVQMNISFLRFDLSDEDIEMLKKGISKISIYTVPKVFRKQYKQDKLGKKLYDAFMDVKDEF